MPSRKCAHPGCKAWAVRGTDHCYAHRQLSPGAEIDAVELDAAAARADRSAAFAYALRTGQLEDLIEEAVQQVIDRHGSKPMLNTEIGALRVVLQRVMAVDALDGDPQATAATVTRLVDSIVRAIKAQRQLSGGATDDIANAITTMLIEMGLGGES
jgi:hypothetical protein